MASSTSTESSGIDALQWQADAILSNFELQESLRFAICGTHSVGKSILIQALRWTRCACPDLVGLKGAEPGVTQDPHALEVSWHCHAGLFFQEVVCNECCLEDIERLKLSRAEGCILVYVGEPQLSMLQFADVLEGTHHVPVFLVQMLGKENIDGDASGSLAELSSFRLLTDQCMRRAGERYALFADYDHLFLFEASCMAAIHSPTSHDRSLTEIDRLKELLHVRMQNGDRQAQVRAIFSGNSEKLAELRKLHCEQHIWALMAAGVSASVAPFLPFASVMVLAATYLFLRVFCLLPADVDHPELVKKMSQLKLKIAPRVLTLAGPYIAADAGTDVLLGVPVIGVALDLIAGAGVNAAGLYKFCHDLTPLLQSVATASYDIVLQGDEDGTKLVDFDKLVDSLFSLPMANKKGEWRREVRKSLREKRNVNTGFNAVLRARRNLKGISGQRYNAVLRTLSITRSTLSQDMEQPARVLGMRSRRQEFSGHGYNGVLRTQTSLPRDMEQPAVPTNTSLADGDSFI